MTSGVRNGGRVALALLLLLCARCGGGDATPDAVDVAPLADVLPLDLVADGDASRDLDLAAREDLAEPDTAPDVADTAADVPPDLLPRPACLLEDPNGQPVLRADCVNVYRTCDGEPERYLMVSSGADRALEMAELAEWKAALEDDLFALDPVDAVGLAGRCCAASTNAACVQVRVAQNTGMALEDLATVVADALCRQDVCLSVLVVLPAPGTPRCAADDPACLPLPLCDPERCGVAGGCCATCRPYDPARERLESIGRLVPAEFEGLELPDEENDGECSHDGDCARFGCGQFCGSFDDRSFFSSCECYPDLSVSHCGCVDGRCRWFHQEL